jgi:hypothetical protein
LSCLAASRAPLCGISSAAFRSRPTWLEQGEGAQRRRSGGCCTDAAASAAQPAGGMRAREAYLQIQRGLTRDLCGTGHARVRAVVIAAAQLLLQLGRGREEEQALKLTAWLEVATRLVAQRCLHAHATRPRALQLERVPKVASSRAERRASARASEKACTGAAQFLLSIHVPGKLAYCPSARL